LIEETEFFLEETKLVIALPMAISFVITAVVFVVDKTIIYLCTMFIKLIVQILSFLLIGVWVLVKEQVNLLR